MTRAARSITHVLLGLALVAVMAVGAGVTRAPATAHAFDIFTGVTVTAITAYNAAPNYTFCTWDEVAQEAECPIVFSGISGVGFTQGGTVRVTVSDSNYRANKRRWMQDVQVAGGGVFLLNLDPLAAWELMSWCPPFNSDPNQTPVQSASVYTIEAQDLSTGFITRTNAFKVCGPDAGPVT